MPEPKLTNDDVRDIQNLLKQGMDAKELAEIYNVSRSVIYRRAIYPYHAKYIPLETKNKIIKKIKEGYTKAEAAQMYNIPINTVMGFTKGMLGYKSEGYHIIRKNGIELLNRLMTDGYLISDFIVPTVRNLQRRFPMIKSARYKDKTFFYLEGREAEAIEAFFKEKPDRIISYSSIEEMSYLPGVKISNKDQRKLLERYRKKHDDYWRSRRLIQRSIDDWVDDATAYSPGYADESFRLMPRRK